MKKLVLVLAGIMAMNIVACTQFAEDKGASAPKSPGSKAAGIDVSKKKLFHGDMETVTPADPTASIIDTLKSNKLNIDSTKTIGQVFDGYKYAKKKAWRGTLGMDGSYYIDFICNLDGSSSSSLKSKNDVCDRSLEVKFVVHKDGETYVAVVSRTDQKKGEKANTVRYFPEDREKIVRAIYENREIPF